MKKVQRLSNLYTSAMFFIVTSMYSNSLIILPLEVYLLFCLLVYLFIKSHFWTTILTIKLLIVQFCASLTFLKNSLQDISVFFVIVVIIIHNVHIIYYSQCLNNILFSMFI